MRNILSISLSFFFIFLCFLTAQQYFLILFEADGKENLALISLVLIYGGFLAAGTVAPSLIARLGGLKSSLIIGASTYALFTAVLTLENTLLLLASSIVVGVGACLLWVASGQIIADESSDKTAGRNFAYQSVATSAGGIAGIILGGYLVAVESASFMYLILAAFGLVGTLILFFLKPIREETKSRPFRPMFILDIRMLSLFPFLFGTYYLLGQLFTATSLIVVGLLGLSSVPALVIALRISNVIGAFGSGIFADRFNKAGILVFVTILSLAGIVLLVSTATMAPILIGTILIGFSGVTSYPVTLAWLKESLPEEEYIYSLGVFHVYANIGVIAALAANMWLSPRASFIPGLAALIIGLGGIVLFEKLASTRSSMH
ncbi:MAG: MFS transporter [Patescibacteria group bacterium]